MVPTFTFDSDEPPLNHDAFEELRMRVAEMKIRLIEEMDLSFINAAVMQIADAGVLVDDVSSGDGSHKKRDMDVHVPYDPRLGF